MKKLLTTIVLAFTMAIAANAQFEQATKYLSTSLSGLGLSYNKADGFRFGLQADAGYFIADEVLLRGTVGYDHSKLYDEVQLGIGARYYFRQNGIFLGAGAEFTHYSPNFNDIRIPVEIGYAFYLNHYLAIEPAVFYKMSLNNFSDHSTVGLRLGLGFYF